MALIRYRPYSLLTELQDEMNRMLGEHWPSAEGNGSSGMAAVTWTPAVDVKEENDCFVFIADIPGVDPNDIDVRMDENGVLTISGEKKSEEKKEEKGYTRIERFSGSFYRRFSLPDTADPHQIDAKAKHGVLKISVAKRSKATPKSIKVKSEE